MKAFALRSLVRLNAAVLGQMSRAVSVWGITALFSLTLLSGAAYAQTTSSGTPMTTAQQAAFMSVIQELLLSDDDPANGAVISAASVPTWMLPGSTYNVSLTLKNTGTLTWTQSDYALGSTSQDAIATWGLQRVTIPATSVASGASVTFNFQVQAPATAGTYLFDWGMVLGASSSFGQTSRTSVIVGSATTSSAAQPTISVSRPALIVGQAVSVNWSTTNATSLTHVCTSSGSGYTVNESVAVSGSRSITPSSAWVGSPSSCTWTASGTGGTATYSETMTTSPPLNSSVTYSTPMAWEARWRTPMRRAT